jgi:hypothetical protein
MPMMALILVLAASASHPTKSLYLLSIIHWPTLLTWYVFKQEEEEPWGERRW